MSDKVDVKTTDGKDVSVNPDQVTTVERTTDKLFAKDDFEVKTSSGESLTIAAHTQEDANSQVEADEEE